MLSVLKNQDETPLKPTVEATEAHAGLHKRWLERKLEIEVGKVQAKLQSKGLAVPVPDAGMVEASLRHTQAHLPKLHLELYGRNTNGTIKTQPETPAVEGTPPPSSLVQRLDRLLNPSLLMPLPYELAAARGIPPSILLSTTVSAEPSGNGNLPPEALGRSWDASPGRSPAGRPTHNAHLGPQGLTSPAARQGTATGLATQGTFPGAGTGAAAGSPGAGAGAGAGAGSVAGAVGAGQWSVAGAVPSSGLSLALFHAQQHHGNTQQPYGPPRPPPGADSYGGAAGTHSGSLPGAEGSLGAGPSGGGGGGGGGGGEGGSTSGGVPRPSRSPPGPSHWRPDLQGADARIEDALELVQRVAMQANEMAPRDRVIYLARQANPNFSLPQPRTSHLSSCSSSDRQRGRRELSRRNSMRVTSFSSDAAPGFGGTASGGGSIKGAPTGGGLQPSGGSFGGTSRRGLSGGAGAVSRRSRDSNLSRPDSGGHNQHHHPQQHVHNGAAAAAAAAAPADASSLPPLLPRSKSLGRSVSYAAHVAPSPTAAGPGGGAGGSPSDESAGLRSGGGAGRAAMASFIRHDVEAGGGGGGLPSLSRNASPVRHPQRDAVAAAVAAAAGEAGGAAEGMAAASPRSPLPPLGGPHPDGAPVTTPRTGMAVGARPGTMVTLWGAAAAAKAEEDKVIAAAAREAAEREAAELEAAEREAEEAAQREAEELDAAVAAAASAAAVAAAAKAARAAQTEAEIAADEAAQEDMYGGGGGGREANLLGGGDGGPVHRGRRSSGTVDGGGPNPRGHGGAGSAGSAGFGAVPGGGGVQGGHHSWTP